MPQPPDDTAPPELMGIILDGLREGVVATDRNGHIVYANRASRELVGVSLIGEEEAERQARTRPRYEDRQTPVPHDQAPLVRALRGEHVENMMQWIRIEHDDSEMLLSINAAPLRDGTGEISGAVAWFRDITASKRMENELRRLAHTDPLTGAFNRRHGVSSLTAELQRRERYGTSVSILLLDVDHFKAINDRHGHEAGDDALRALVARCGGKLRKVDSIVRWGGEEFLLILPETGLEGAVTLAERLREAMESVPLRAGGQQVRFTVSIGVAHAESNDPQDLIHQADTALYQAKAAGRNRVVTAGVPAEASA